MAELEQHLVELMEDGTLSADLEQNGLEGLEDLDVVLYTHEVEKV